LIQTVPTTLAGVLALVETVAEPEYEHGDVSDAIIVGRLEDSVRAVHNLLAPSI
jgi:hypothetical protein